MALKEKFFAMIAALDESEKQQLRDALGAPGEQTVAEETAAPPALEASSEDKGAEAAVEDDASTDADEPAAEGNTEAEAGTEEKGTEEEIPAFDKTDDPPDPDAEEEPVAEPEPVVEPEPVAEPEPEPVSDEQGDSMPMDYQQIIDGMNAKIMALEAENAGLKAKTEGAFGLQSKPGEFAKMNPLFDDDTSDIHIRK